MKAVNTSKRRRMRRTREVRGSRRGRLRRLNAWLDARALPAASGGIGDTAAAGASVTPVPASNTITETTHGLSSGGGPYLITGGTQPTGIDPNRPYFLDVKDADSYGIVGDGPRGRANAILAVSNKQFSTVGATVIRTQGTTRRSFFALVQAGRRPATVQAATDIADIIF